MTLSVCVFCGSRYGTKPEFREAAIQLGEALAKTRMRLVYGAGDIGLMGAIARSTQEADGSTFGVIPEHLLEREVGKTDLSRFIITENMHERKKVMFMNADAIVLLPGGAGSLDEFFEVLTWAQLGLHSKPIVVLNINDYWKPLLALVDHVVEHEFADGSIKEFYSVVNSVDDAVATVARLTNDDRA